MKDDYVWGARVCTITPGNYAAMSRVASGDLLQFRNVKLSGSYKVGNTTYTYSKSAAHHSAVVTGRLGDGTMLHVFHENSGGKLYVTHGLYRIRDLKQGTIWGYRAK